MIWLLLGLGTFLLLMAALREFARADVASVKALIAWIVALGGIALSLLLLLSGRGLFAFVALPLLGPAFRDLFLARRRPAAPPPGAARPPPRAGAMGREEALSVLGLPPGAGEAEIRAAHLRLMRAAHPDNGGSDWLATRINQARDVLLGR
ncbi:MAG: hypothetical protein JO209_08730 [Acidisphaera sp.]|nr:hypothetical protein [Acidisphaera sp.]